MQRLIDRLVALGRFIAHFTDKLKPFFLTLRRASTFGWTNKCKHTFEVVKPYLIEPPILSSPKSNEQLYMYLVVYDCVVNAILFRHIQDKEQMPVYYMSKAMVDADTWYSRIEQTTLALKNAP